MKLQWEMLHPKMTVDRLGYIPDWLHSDDPRSARDQIHFCYTHGGGWHPFNGFKMNDKQQLTYPGDPPTKPLAKTQLRDETIIFYDHAWVAIVQKDGSFEVARID